MTRGNQREVDRARAQARDAKNQPSAANAGMTPQQRNERDRLALLEKQAKKAAAKEAGDGDKNKGVAKPGKPGTVDGPGKKKKKKVKNEDLSALLSEGLTVSGKKKK